MAQHGPHKIFVLSVNVLNFDLLLIIFRIIMTCGVLHNVLRMRNIPLPEPATPFVSEERAVQELNQAPQDGLRFRDYVCNMHF